MEGSTNSFQDIMKLMNSMTAFETLLDAANLKPDVCVNLGIHEQFSQLLGKLGKCIKEDNTTDLNFSCVCNLCSEEIKILTFDIRTSLAIHNASEIHRVAIKNKDLDQQNKANECNAEENLGAHAVENLGAHAVQNLDTYAVGNLGVYAVENLGAYAVQNVGAAHTVQLNNVVRELKKQSPDEKGLSVTQNERIVNDLNVASPVCYKCRQSFCMCDFKENPLIDFKEKPLIDLSGKLPLLDLSEKLTNLNIPQQNVPHRFRAPKAPLLPPFGQEHIPRGRYPSPQSHLNHKPQENKQRSRSQAEPARTQQSINIHVHVPTTPNQYAASAAQPPVRHHPNQHATTATQPPVRNQSNPKKNATDENLDKLKSKQLNVREVTQLMYKMIREAEGVHWKRENVSKVGNEYICNICHTDSRIKNSFDMVMHVRGRFHQDNLKSATSSSKKPQNSTQNRNSNTERTTQSRQNVSRPPSNLEGNLNDSNMEVLRKRLLDERAERSLMWKMVKESEGEHWIRGRITTQDDEFWCSMCDMRLNSPHQLVQHVAGASHTAKLNNPTIVHHAAGAAYSSRRGDVAKAVDDPCALM